VKYIGIYCQEKTVSLFQSIEDSDLYFVSCHFSKCLFCSIANLCINQSVNQSINQSIFFSICYMNEAGTGLPGGPEWYAPHVSQQVSADV